MVGDVNPCPIEDSNLIFRKTDVTSWTELSALFQTADQLYGKINHVFANAGISNRTTFLEDKVDENGMPCEPNLQVLDINLKAVIYTTTLAVHYLKKQPEGGSIVMTASASSYQRFRAVDYSMHLSYSFMI